MINHFKARHFLTVFWRQLRPAVADGCQTMDSATPLLTMQSVTAELGMVSLTPVLTIQSISREC